MKEKATRYIQCYGINVHCNSVLGSPKCFLCATSGRRRTNRILSGKSSRNVLGRIVCICNGNDVVPFRSLYPCITYMKNNPISYLQVLIELPYVLVQAIVYTVIVYSMIGFEWTVGKFLWYFFIMYFTLLYFTFYGMMAVAMTPNHHIASILSFAFFALWNLFSGFVVPKPVRFVSNFEFFISV